MPAALPKRIPPPALSASKEEWVQYREARNLFHQNTDVPTIIEKTGLDAEVVESWAYHIWCREQTNSLQLEVQKYIDINKEKVLEVINDTLEIVQLQMKTYKKLSKEGAPLKVSEVKALTETARNLQGLIESQEAKEAAESKKANVVREATIRGVADIVKLLKKVDPDIEYDKILETGSE